jgi:hypothetical protein
MSIAAASTGTFRLSLKAGQSSEIPLPAWRHTPPSLRRRRVRSGICANPATIRNSTLLFPAISQNLPYNTQNLSLLLVLARTHSNPLKPLENLTANRIGSPCNF